jgi:hypothetical protein
MSKRYELVNPLIIGSFDRTFTADNSLQAAHSAYQELSQYFVGHIPKFKFTLQRVKRVSSLHQTGGGKDADYLHFEVYETKDKKSFKGISYAIKPLNTEVHLDNFQQKLQNFMQRKKTTVLTSEEKSEEQDGGRKKYVDDEELDPELEEMLEDDYDFKSKKKTIKRRKWYALNGPLKGQNVDLNPITYYRYDPILYAETYSYIPIFTPDAGVKRILMDNYEYTKLLNKVLSSK